MPRLDTKRSAPDGTQSVPGCIPTPERGIDRCAELLRQLQIIQHPIHRQFPEHDQLRDAHQCSALGWFHQSGEFLGDGFGGGEGFAGVGQQVFVFGVGGDGVHGAGAEGRWGGAGWAEVMVEGAVGGLVEFF